MKVTYSKKLLEKGLQFLAEGSDVTTTGTKAEILDTTATLGKFAYATDTYEFYMGDGTNWRKVPFKLIPESANPNMGYLPDEGDNIGYSPTYVSNKTLTNIKIGYSTSNLGTGSLRITTAGYLEVYLNDVWNKIVMNFVFLEDSDNNYTFEHQPIGFTSYIVVMSGNSINNLGLNGLPIVQQYRVDMGAYPSRNVLGGRSF